MRVTACKPRRNPIGYHTCPYLGLGILVSRSVRKQVSVVPGPVVLLKWQPQLRAQPCICELIHTFLWHECKPSTSPTLQNRNATSIHICLCVLPAPRRRVSTASWKACMLPNVISSALVMSLEAIHSCLMSLLSWLSSTSLQFTSFTC